MMLIYKCTSDVEKCTLVPVMYQTLTFSYLKLCAQVRNQNIPLPDDAGKDNTKVIRKLYVSWIMAQQKRNGKSTAG